jgi:heat-inducible transcriptional repressor
MAMDPFVVHEVLISKRTQRLLKTLIEQYIREGKPVGSRNLARQAGLDVSPATVRNVMADLEALGLVASPHASAGRIPTAKGYRFFVDTLMTVTPLATREVQRFKDQFNPDESVQELLGTASSLLSGVTHLASVVMWPRRRRIVLRQVEFLPLADNRILAILVLNEREVKSRVVRTERQLSPAELQQAANYLNQAFANQDVFIIRQGLLREMHEASEHMDRIITAATEMAQKVFSADSARDDYILTGQTHLFDFADPGGLDKLRHLFEAFSQKRDILNLLDECLNAGGMQICIGEESGYHVLDEFSVVTSPYSVSGQVWGVLGVIGPTRMPYEKVVPIVDTTARLLSEALNQQQ